MSKIIEEQDDTDLSGEVACAGGACEIDFDKPKNTPPKPTHNTEQPFAAAVNFESENSGQI